MQERERLKRSRILHAADHIVPVAVGVIPRPLVCPFFHLGAVPEGTCRYLIAASHKRRTERVWESCKARSKFLQVIGIRQRDIPGEGVRPLRQIRICRKQSSSCWIHWL